MKEKLTIVKIGGNVIDNEASLNEFIRVFSELSGHKLLVHGGGKIATQTATALGIETQMINGRRITGDEMINVAVMTYAGLINKKIVALLQKEHIPSIGISGCDGNAILATKRPVVNGIDYGWVGDVSQVNGPFLHSLLNGNTVPVMCALTHDGQGNMLNTNADTIANETAIALSEWYEVTLNYCFELPGVLKNMEDPTSLIREIDLEIYAQLKKDEVVSSGMIPKLDNAFNAIVRGVKCVNILNVKSLSQIENKDYHEYTSLR